MKKILHKCFLAILVLSFGCGPKNEEIQEENIEAPSTASIKDSITTVRQDAVETDDYQTPPVVLPLPQPVLAIIQDKYPNWEQPSLTEEAERRAENHEQGPFIVRGDFNGDGLQDCAVQVQAGNDLVILGFIQEEGNWQMHELRRDILFNSRGNLQSLYYLYNVDPGTELSAQNEQQQIETEHDAVAVGITGNTTVYAYENGNFSAYNFAD
ncbi:hypothetical protein [Pontibacter harenae]|uniref:hypothetical protein n=1 Tax=Pontibacter harenae TaxID=2894083 RepID=UPI001E29F5B2|nr:hypothetical protein [Pontibacter harenae]MCC9165763.1 hypothetical protein [Pontibacter harenae]